MNSFFDKPIEATSTRQVAIGGTQSDVSPIIQLDVSSSVRHCDFNETLKPISLMG